MRKDPPFDTEYIYATYLLELAAEAGTLVVNRPRALRDTNEKLAIARFPQCAPPTLVTRDAARLRAFAAEHGDVILKPLHGMGGTSVFRLRPGDPNLNVVIETLTTHGSEFAMAQRYIPEIAAGDKRILLVDGEPVPYALARVPAPGETRGNLAAGATGQGVPLGERDRWICAEVGPWLREQGLLFVGLDVIGDDLHPRARRAVRPRHRRPAARLHRASPGMRQAAALLGLALLSGLFSGCDEPPRLREERIQVFGTWVDLALWGVDDATAARAIRVIQGDLGDLHTRWQPGNRAS
jgi:hypothetical protein